VTDGVGRTGRPVRLPVVLGRAVADTRSRSGRLGPLANTLLEAQHDAGGVGSYAAGAGPAAESCRSVWTTIGGNEPYHGADRMRRAIAAVCALLLCFIAVMVASTREQRSAWIARPRFGEHTSLARQFFAYAAASDTAGLVRMSIGVQPVDWALAFGRYPQARAAAGARLISGARAGSDTLLLTYDVPAHWCPGPDEPNNLQLILVRLRSNEWRVLHAGAEPC
jgi:hypothetical protein